jgi:hypothetical protein
MSCAVAEERFSDCVVTSENPSPDFGFSDAALIASRMLRMPSLMDGTRAQVVVVFALSPETTPCLPESVASLPARRG